MSNIMDIENSSIHTKEVDSIDINKLNNMDLFLAQLLCDFKFAVLAQRDLQYISKSPEVSELNGGEVYDVPMDLTVPSRTRRTNAVRHSHNDNFAVLEERDVQYMSKSLEASELYCREADVPMDLTVAGPNGTQAVCHKGNFKCKFPGCLKSFASSKYLNQHKVSHRPAKFRCSLCTKKYRRRSALVYHRKYTHACKPYACDHDNCNEEFMSSDLLEKHRSQKHSKCCFCGEGFLNLAGLKLHLRKCRLLEEVIVDSDAKRRWEAEQNTQLSPASSIDQPGDWIMSTASKSPSSVGTSGYSSSPDRP